MGTGGHRTGAGVGKHWPAAIMYAGPTCLKVSWRPKACLGWRDGINVPGMPLVDGFEALSSKGRQSFRRRCLLTFWEYGACLARGPRGCCVLSTPHMSPSVWTEDEIVTWRTPRGWGNLGEGLSQITTSSVRRVILSRSKGQRGRQNSSRT